MKQSLVFLLRATVFLGAVFSKIHFRETYIVDYSSKTQILLSSLQMAVVFVALGVYRLCLYVVAEIKLGAQYTQMQDELEFDEWLENENTTAKEEAHKEEQTQDERCEPTSLAPTLDVIVFADADALRAYVRKIHTTAVLLWGTFYSIDMGRFAVLFYFVSGLFLGWTILLFVQRSRVCVSSNSAYAMLCIGILSINLPVTRPPDGSDVLAVCVMPFVFGLGWQLWVNPRTVFEDTKSVFVTGLLLCGLILALSDWSELRGMLASTRLVFVFLMVVEPLVKSMALSVLVVSVQTQQQKTMMLIFVATYALASLYTGVALSDILFLFTLSMTLMLCLMQLGAVVFADVRGYVRDDNKNDIVGQRI